MIDLDEMESQLTAAVSEDVGRPSGTMQMPAPRRRHRVEAPPAPALVAGGVPTVLALGRLDDVDDLIAAAADLCDRLTWTTMRALLEGNEDAARAGLRALRDLGDEAEAVTRSWIQRFWVAFEWGSEGERYDVLDHCRKRAYGFDDLRWWGNLTLLLAAMGKTDEATRAFDATLPLVVAGDAGLDSLTNLVEAAAMLGDAARVAAAGRQLHASGGGLVVVGAGVVCKGSVDRYWGLVLAALGQLTPAGECFRKAEALHRSIGASVLLTRTLQQASGALVAA